MGRLELVTPSVTAENLSCLRAKILSGQINRPGAITELKGTWITGMIGFYAKQTFQNITV